MSAMSFLSEPAETPQVLNMYDEDLSGDGYVMDLTRVWAHTPRVHVALVALLTAAAGDAELTFKERAIIITALSSTLGDSYCSIAWGERLAGASSPETAVAVLTGTDEGLSECERALASWARKVARDPNGTTAADVAALREAGFDEHRIVALTAYAAARLAFATVNDALGATPDPELRARTAPEVLAAVTWGR